jgi:hypothetical protein
MPPVLQPCRHRTWKLSWDGSRVQQQMPRPLMQQQQQQRVGSERRRRRKDGEEEEEEEELEAGEATTQQMRMATVPLLPWHRAVFLPWSVPSQQLWTLSLVLWRPLPQPLPSMRSTQGSLQ